MGPPEHERSRPATGPASSNLMATKAAEAHSTLGADILGELDALAAHVDGAFVVVVRVTGTQYRRRCYLTAKAAESAARKATDRGENAAVYLAELKPLWRIIGGEG